MVLTTRRSSTGVCLIYDDTCLTYVCLKKATFNAGSYGMSHDDTWVDHMHSIVYHASCAILTHAVHRALSLPMQCIVRSLSSPMQCFIRSVSAPICVISFIDRIIHRLHMIHRLHIIHRLHVTHRSIVRSLSLPMRCFIRSVSTCGISFINHISYIDCT